MIPIASHQEILEDTRRHHHTAMMELEHGLRNQYQKQLQELVEQDEKKQKEFQETLVHVRSGLKKLETQRDESVKKVKSTDDELYNLKNAMRKMSSENKELEEGKRLFAQSLEEANANLGRLRQILEDEKNAHLTVQREVQELKRKWGGPLCVSNCDFIDFVPAILVVRRFFRVCGQRFGYARSLFVF